MEAGVFAFSDHIFHAEILKYFQKVSIHSFSEDSFILHSSPTLCQAQ